VRVSKMSATSELILNGSDARAAQVIDAVQRVSVRNFSMRRESAFARDRGAGVFVRVDGCVGAAAVDRRA
jgi:hypothetical protein